LPKDFKLTANFNWEQNIVTWRGPWVDTVLEQDCVVGAGLREIDAAAGKAQRDKRIEQALQNFGMSSVHVPDAAQSDLLVDEKSFLAFTRASFADRTEEETQQLRIILGGWEQTKKDIAAADKRAKARSNINAVNSLDLPALREESDRAQAAKLQQDLTSLQASIDKCGKKSEEGLKQYSLAVTRGNKCQSLLPTGDIPPPFSVSSKRCIEMLLSNVTNGDGLWNAALQEVSKIRRMDLEGNAPAALMRDEFEEPWASIEESRYAIDVDSGIIHAANLAGSWMGEHGDEMQELFDLSGLN
jgi:hypothetical protein